MVKLIVKSFDFGLPLVLLINPSFSNVIVCRESTDHFISAPISHFTQYAVTYEVNPVNPASNAPATTTTQPVITAAPPPSTTTTTTPPVAAQTVKRLPATFAASSLIINPTKVKTRENVGIYLKITNTGNVTGTDTVVLKINDQIIGSQNVILDGGVSTVVTFSASVISSGNFSVQVAGLSGNFIVTKSIVWQWLWLTIVVILLLGVMLVIVLILLRNRKPGQKLRA
ncbi:MAG: hypothetical protein WCC72_05045 [Dehalococcoidales bacterium]